MFQEKVGASRLTDFLTIGVVSHRDGQQGDQTAGGLQ